MEDHSEAMIKKKIAAMLAERKARVSHKSLLQTGNTLWFTVTTDDPITSEDVENLKHGPPYLVLAWAIFYSDDAGHTIFTSTEKWYPSLQ
jgi:hypothetical protein